MSADINYRMIEHVVVIENSACDVSASFIFENGGLRRIEVNDRERLISQEWEEKYEAMYAMLSEHLGARSEPPLECLRQVLAERDKWQQNALDQTAANDCERASWQERLEGMRGERDGERQIAQEWESKYEDMYAMLSDHLGARSEPPLECLRRVLAERDKWQQNALDQTAANDCERASWQERLAQLQADKDHLLDAIDKDHTGLTQALSAVVKVIEGFSWVADGRGPYEWNDTRYQKETYNAFQAVAKIIKPALMESGTRANEAWKTFERGRIVKLSVELDWLRAQLRTLLEGAHRHVTKGHHCKCASVESIVNLDSLTATPKGPCDCGFDELRDAIKAQP